MSLIDRAALDAASAALPAHLASLGALDTAGVRRVIVSKLGPGPIVKQVKHSFA